MCCMCRPAHLQCACPGTELWASAQALRAVRINGFAAGDLVSAKEAQDAECLAGYPKFSNANEQEVSKRSHHAGAAATVLEEDALTRAQGEMAEENDREDAPTLTLGKPSEVSYLPDSHCSNISTTESD